MKTKKMEFRINGQVFPSRTRLTPAGERALIFLNNLPDGDLVTVANLERAIDSHYGGLRFLGCDPFFEDYVFKRPGKANLCGNKNTIAALKLHEKQRG